MAGYAHPASDQAPGAGIPDHPGDNLFSALGRQPPVPADAGRLVPCQRHAVRQGDGVQPACMDCTGLLSDLAFLTLRACLPSGILHQLRHPGWRDGFCIRCFFLRHVDEIARPP